MAQESPHQLVEPLMVEVVDQGSAIVGVRARLQRLLEVNRSIVGELSLPAVLRRIVEAARDVAGARYAALGVIGSDGLLEEFVHVGLDEATVAAIGQLPEGHGLLGALIEDPEPIRLPDIAGDPRSSGFPPGHPPMAAFLGVPIRSRGQVFGNLYLTERVGGGEFTAEDEELITALATTASIAIENARLYEESRQRQEWLRASGEISRQLLSGDGGRTDTLHRIAVSVKRLAAADVVSVVLPVPDSDADLEVVTATGVGQTELTGLRYPRADSIAWQAIQAGHGVIVRDVDQRPGIFLHLRPIVAVSQVMAVPLVGQTGARGALTVGRISHHVAFTDEDLDMAETFAGQATLALELSDARADRQRLAGLEDRDRIGRDLHDHVIQRLFATGLGLQSTSIRAADPDIKQRIGRSVDDLDETIRQIRTTIFSLHDDQTGHTLRGQVKSVVDELQPVLGIRIDLVWSGPVDIVSDPVTVADVEAVVREALTNVARHAQASEVRVEVRADGTRLEVEVTDNGVGLPSSPQRRSGLANLTRRAENRGGNLAHENAAGGLRLRWTIPLR